MIHGFFATLIYIPLYNALVFIIDHTPAFSAGLAIIILTIIVRLILYPLSKTSIKTQFEMKRVAPQLQVIKETIKDREEQARATLKLYRDNGINPFAGIFLILLQLPIMIGIYRVFQSGLPKIDTTLLYSFVTVPEAVSMYFLGINLLKGSFLLAVAVVITQFIQFQLAMPTPEKKPKSATDKPSLQEDLAQSMSTQMKYIFPLIMFPIAYISSVLALYFLTSNIFMIFQEIFVRRRIAKKYQ
jgi:YidC/Oxa1 family membrane protein insertase